MELVIGRIGKAHGLRGEVTVGLRTDEPQQRFAVGSQIETDPSDRGPLTVSGVRFTGGRAVIAFENVADRNAAEALHGTMLVIDTDALPPLTDDDDYYDHELIGMSAALEDGRAVGVVADVLHGPGGDTLAITREGGGEALVPFVREIVPSIDRAARALIIDPPDGLLEL